MNLSKSYARHNLGEEDHYSSKNSKSSPPRSCRRDPFEGDPFKIQSLNFRYADKPGYPVCNRGKGSASSAEKSAVKGIYFNHDHTIPKLNKENLPPRLSGESKPQCSPCQKSSSIRSCAVASKTFRIEEEEFSRTTSSIFADSQSQFSLLNSRRSLTKMNARTSSMSQRQVSQISELSALNRGGSLLTMKKSKPCICIPTMSKAVTSASSTTTTGSPAQKRFSRSKSNISNPMTDIDVNHSGSCHVTIKINGVPKNRVHIAKNRNNVEINLVKQKKFNKKLPTKPPPKPASPHALRPSRSYVIQSGETSTTSDLRKSSRRGSSRNAMKECSTLSMVPHKEEKCSLPEPKITSSSLFERSKYSNLSSELNSSDWPSVSSTSDRPTVLYTRNNSRTSIPNKISDKHAEMLEKILSNNPIILQPKGRVIFRRDQTALGHRFSSVAVQAGN